MPPCPEHPLTKPHPLTAAPSQHSPLLISDGEDEGGNKAGRAAASAAGNYGAAAGTTMQLGALNGGPENYRMQIKHKCNQFQK